MNSAAILLVEDNSNDVELTRRALEKAQILKNLIVAEDGIQALDYLNGTGNYHGRDKSQSPALVLLDIKLPGIDGLEVLKRIRSNASTRRQPVIILTSSIEEYDLENSYDLGVNSYIRKPVDFAEFTQTIGHLVRYWLAFNEPPPPLVNRI